jgi:KEOPS complex subunit Pcc1
VSGRPHRATLTIEYEDEPVARTVERSLRQEVGEIDDDRSSTRLDREGRQLYLTIDAADLVALRAAANTWLSLASVAERVAETVDF